MRFFLTLFFKILSALLLGLLVTAYSMQYNARCKNKVGELLKQLFETSFHCKAVGEIDSFNLFTASPYAILSQMKVTPKNGSDWSWECDRFIVSCSWLDILWNRKLGIMSEIHGIKAYSFVDEKNIALMDHVGVLLNMSKNVPLELRTLYMHKGSLQVYDKHKKFLAACSFEADVNTFKGKKRALVYIQDGKTSYNEYAVAENASLRISSEASKDGGKTFVAGTFCTPYLQSCYLSASWQQNKGMVHIHTKEKSFAVDADIVCVEDAFKCTFSCAADWLGNPSGDFCWSIAQACGTLTCSNATRIEHGFLGAWQSEPHDIMVTGTVHGSGSAALSYAGRIAQNNQENMHECRGTLLVQPNRIECAGIFDGFRYTCTAAGIDDFLLHMSERGNDIPIISCSQKEKNEYHMTLSCDRVRSLLARLGQGFVRSEILSAYDTPVDGILSITARQGDHAVKADFSMEKGNIRLGEIYNFLQECGGTLETALDRRSISLKNCFFNLHRGKLLIPYARLLFDDQATVQYCFIPLHMRSVFLSIARDLFMLVSGHIVFIKKAEKTIIKGHITIDRGQMVHTLSSGDEKNITNALSLFMGSAEGKDVECDITIDSKYPLHVQAGFLAGNVKPMLTLQGSLQHPSLAGKISIVDGMFRFPYRPLTITQGTLYSMPYALHDPTLEIDAKGKIKQYTIRMHVSGTVRNPHINFSSTPSLTQEQIITLLFGGSETGSLRSVVPSFVLQNMQNLLFGSEQISENIQKFLFPLRYVRIVPSFTDQKGRGGFRGALEIDVTDQLRAVIQRNFSLPEDTRFEVEYQISDEISVRGLKDERSDIGGEIEMRFTF